MILKKIKLPRPLKQQTVDAVDTRQELDLRIGAAFTRLQTLFLRKKFPQNITERIVSFGSCQFPTLGFIVERWRAVQEFQPEPFWKIEVLHRRNNINTIFNWYRGRIFSQDVVKAFHEDCTENPRQG